MKALFVTGGEGGYFQEVEPFLSYQGNPEAPRQPKQEAE